MVEASMVLPLLILAILSLVTLMLFDVQGHSAQVALHMELLEHWDQSEKIFDIEKNQTETSSEIKGLAVRWMNAEKEARIYVYQPAQWIRYGEMLHFDEE